MKITPLLTLLFFTLTVTGISGIELHALLSNRGSLQQQAQANQARQRENDTRKKNLADLVANEDAIKASVRKINGGISSEAPPVGSFMPLHEAGVPVELQPSGADTWSFRFGPSELEFHRLLPVLTALENQYPLLRFNQLELLSTAEPFVKTATALRVQGTFSIVKAKRDLEP